MHGNGRDGGWQVKLCDRSLTHAIPECFRDEFLMIKRYTNLRLLYSAVTLRNIGVLFSFFASPYQADVVFCYEFRPSRSASFILNAPSRLIHKQTNSTSGLNYEVVYGYGTYEFVCGTRCVEYDLMETGFSRAFVLCRRVA